MARALAREIGSRNITVNCIAPGFIDTDMTKVLSEEQHTALKAQIPLGRLGAPEDIAEHLFDPFVSGRPEGKGLGLALVDKLVRDMGGLVQYAREGSPLTTVFRLLLPRADG